ncbi:hypothetical protein CAPTEDRAFT_164570 [Capitella teleta]|uniref:C2H2-type domain-containing protein n=1 Tax=Capitella teleta TaxID=283909 RepID=R7TYW3_CAPTE|nr:hypothetical protein CAPTEDRAFT_164570 [Capitella teleta]|eukprot:ELT99123.1 hypothetical protein CAPTEDRAFT_164570 [Capitella teleta]
MPYIRAARDRHEQNVEVSKDSRGQMVFRCLREITRGEELFVWYCDELARQCGIPVLSPANIRGDSDYTCNRCLKTFRFPNTLKSHMHYHCSSASRISPPNFEAASLAGLTSPPHAKGGVSPDRPSGPRHLQHAEVTSAFRPHQQLSPDRSPPRQPHNEDAPSPSQVPMGRFNFPMPSDKEGEPLDLLPKSLYSSKSAKGHMCIYCGKLYSRKYGLKIHLRTHTGYKPLKCKVCQRPFGDPSNLNKHIRLHAEGATPYRCPHCGKVLVRRRDLERHIRSRHPNESPGSESDGVKTFIGEEEEGSPTALSDISDPDALDGSFGDDNQEIQVDV